MQGTILTAAGIQRFMTATPEDQITITELVVGDGGGAGNSVSPTMSELINETWRGEASAPIRDPNNPSLLTFEATIPADVGGFTIREVGLYDELGQLVAVGVTSETEKPSLSQAVGFTLTIRLHIALSNADDTNLVVQEAGAIDHQGLSNRDALDCHPASAIGINEISDHPELRTAQDAITAMWGRQEDHNERLDTLDENASRNSYQVTLEGDLLVYPGTTGEYTITNYDSFSIYEISASREQVSRSNDKITLTVSPEATDGELTITVKRNGFAHDFVLAIGESGIQTPTITEPAAGSTTGSLAPTLRTSNFASYPQGVDTHISTDWFVALDVGFTNVAWSSIGNTANLTQVTVPNGILTPGTGYYVRARHNGSLYQSDYSTPVAFTAPMQYIVTPTLISPADGAINVGESPVLRSSDFASVPSQFDSHRSSSWIIRKLPERTTVLSVLQSAQNRTSLVVPAGILSVSTQYEAQVRHEGNILRDSAWSVPVDFTTTDRFVPIEPGTPFGGGFFAGLYQQDGKIYALVVAPKAAEFNTAFRTGGANPSGTNKYDGKANTDIFIAASATRFPGAAHCVNGNWGGLNDWFWPSENEFNVIYDNLKPTTSSNATGYGANPNAVPPKTNSRTAGNPAQTQSGLFKAGGSEALASGNYWTSTAFGSDGGCFHATNGQIHGYSYSTIRIVRPIRRVLVGDA